MNLKKLNLSLFWKNIHIFLSYFTETLLIQITQLILTIFSFKYLSNELFYSIGIVQIIQSLGIIYYDSGVYTIVKSAEYKTPRLRNYWLSISLYRFLFFYSIIILISAFNFFLDIYHLNKYYYILIPYIGVTFWAGYITTIIESDGLLSKISYIRSVLTSVLSIISAVLIFYFKLDFFYILQLYIIQIASIICIIIVFKLNFTLKKFKRSNLIFLNDKISFTRNNIWMGFLVENFFLIINYVTNQSTSSVATFFKLDKYLKVFFGFILGFYQRTFFYIQLQQKISYSLKKGLVIFALITVLGLIPLWFVLLHLHHFDFFLYLKLAIFYSAIYCLIFLSFMNTISRNKKTKIIINLSLFIILLTYLIITLIYYYK